MQSSARRQRSDAPSSSADEPRDFESAFAELQRLVQQLEDGGLDLEEAVKLFDRGTRLAAICTRLVDAAELRVTRLTAESASPLSDVPVDT